MDEGGSDAFGIAVALQGENAVIGARNDANGNGSTAGAAYLISLSGSVSIVSTEEEVLADGIELHQNYPNPFAGSTTIPYRLDQSQHVRLEVYDLLGRRVAILVDAMQPAGKHEVDLQSKNLSNGVYFYRLSIDNATIIKNMIRAD